MIWIGLGGVVVALLGFAAWQNHQHKSFCRKLVADLNITPTKANAGDGEYDGASFHYELLATKPVALRVSIECDRTAPFNVIRERRFDRIAKTIGLAVEVQSGDPGFDREFYIESDAFTDHTLLFADHRRSGAVRAAFDVGCNSFYLRDGKLSAQWKPLKSGKLTTDDVRSGVAALANFVADLPGSENLQSGKPSRDRWFMGVMWVGLALSFVGSLLFQIGLNKYRPLDGDLLVIGLKAGTGLWLAASVLSAVWLWGRSRSHRQLLALTIVWLMVFPIGTPGAMLFMNGWLDSSPAVPHRVQAGRKWVSKSDKKTNYNVAVPSWRPQRENETIQVTKSAHETIVPGETEIEASARAGFLGFEWVERSEIVADSAPAATD